MPTAYSQYKAHLPSPPAPEGADTMPTALDPALKHTISRDPKKLTPIDTARLLANLSTDEAPVADAADFRADDGKTLCWRVLFWASEEDAKNDSGAKAVAEVIFADEDPDGTATVKRA